MTVVRAGHPREVAAVSGRGVLADRRDRSRSGHGDRGPFSRIMGVVVIIVGVAGVACLAVVVMPLLGWQMVVLTSGSMSPGLPTGSVVIVREVSASEVTVGDIVMVDRDENSSVTHRVTEIEGGGSSLRSRILTLQGDANSAPDPQPYHVSSAGLVTAGVPWGGEIVLGMRNPFVIGGLSVAIALLVLWTWWPKKGEKL